MTTDVISGIQNIIMCPHKEGVQKRTVTGSIISGCSNTEQILKSAEERTATVVRSNNFGTAADAKSHLRNAAVEHILGRPSSDVTNAKQYDGDLLKQAAANLLSETAVNLFVLGGTDELRDTEKYKEACKQLKKAVVSFEKNGVKGFSSTLDIGNAKAHDKSVKLLDAINVLTVKTPAVFTNALDLMHQGYLKDGLVKAEENRRGGRLDEQSVSSSREIGNASQDATQKVVQLLTHHIATGTGGAFTDFINDMLNQLDLFCEVEPDNGSVRQVSDAVPDDRNRHNIKSAGPQGGGITLRLRLRVT
ncbi:hypothetical protein C4K29_3806 [Pseudomonas chlororaphis subsp. piscium]|uniref:hypothetical protein n=1 Tax=Pseudomonas chlororaphis TaxID=587753 RepID=UPI000F56F76D|nr:hypothetical protein [Pseudomonas chlororaphis]AZC90105.1 hypothetical protein C4K29_3806 [Pseudomonas chlororaphis subsp. piscium]